MAKEKRPWPRGDDAPPRLTLKELREAGIVCAICGRPFTRRAEVTLDHIYPWSKGGGDDEKNLQYAHRRCNEWKADLVPWAYCRPKEHPWENFDELVHEAVRRIPPGRVATYGEVAALLGNVHLAGAVARALRRAPVQYPTKGGRRKKQRARAEGAVPCHRVVGAHGELADYLGANGQYNHRKKLRREKITIDEMTVRLGIYGWWVDKG